MTCRLRGSVGGSPLWFPPALISRAPSLLLSVSRLAETHRCAPMQAHAHPPLLPCSGLGSPRSCGSLGPGPVRPCALIRKQGQETCTFRSIR